MAINSAVGTYSGVDGSFYSGYDNRLSTHLADMDGDGILDFVTEQEWMDIITYWSGNGDGTFSTTSVVIDASGIPRGFSGQDADETTFMTIVGSDDVWGTSSTDFLSGTSGADGIYNVGTDDLVAAMDGDDYIQISDTDFALIDGGTGTDTLALSLGGLALDFTADIEAGTDVSEIEVIDLTYGAGNSVTLTDLDVLAMSSTTDTLIIDGNGDDSVTASGGFSQTGTTSQSGDTYDVYESASGATLWINQDILSTNIV